MTCSTQALCRLRHPPTHTIPAALPQQIQFELPATCVPLSALLVFCLIGGWAVAGGRHQPYYHVLVDHRDRPFQSTYVAQENIVRPNSPNASGSSSSMGTDFESEVMLACMVSRVWCVMTTA